ncbi:unnamed protein product [Peniophora sp. CBMAI 1063]|nr:unnamed protein product [Peniophora sp. CBMAI 1063]
MLDQTEVNENPEGVETKVYEDGTTITTRPRQGPVPQLFATSNEVREKYQRDLPTRGERKNNMANMPEACHNSRCGKLQARSTLKTCSQCKAAYYCSPQCQKEDWKDHKKRCTPAGESPAELPLRLARRALGSDRLVDYLTFMALTTWDLHKDPDAGNDKLLEVVCDVQVADLMAYMSRLMAGQRDDDSAEVCLNIERIGAVSLDDPRVPEHISRTARDVRHGMARAHTRDTPLVTFWFTVSGGDPDHGPLSQPDSPYESEDDEAHPRTPEEKTARMEEKRAEAQKEWEEQRNKFNAKADAAAPVNAHKSFTHTAIVQAWQTKLARERSYDNIESGLMGRVKEERTPNSMRQQFNNFVRMDKKNTLKLRAYPARNA